MPFPTTLDGARAVCDAAERVLGPAQRVDAWQIPVIRAVNEMPYAEPSVEVSLWRLEPSFTPTR